MACTIEKAKASWLFFLGDSARFLPSPVSFFLVSLLSRSLLFGLFSFLHPRSFLLLSLLRSFFLGEAQKKQLHTSLSPAPFSRPTSGLLGTAAFPEVCGRKKERTRLRNLHPLAPSLRLPPQCMYTHLCLHTCAPLCVETTPGTRRCACVRTAGKIDTEKERERRRKKKTLHFRQREDRKISLFPSLKSFSTTLEFFPKTLARSLSWRTRVCLRSNALPLLPHV